MRTKHLIIIAVILGLSWLIKFYKTRPIHYGAGVMINAFPKHKIFKEAKNATRYKGYFIKPVALIKIEARILKIQNAQRSCQAISKFRSAINVKTQFLGQCDIVDDLDLKSIFVGWKYMSDDAILSQMRIEIKDIPRIFPKEGATFPFKDKDFHKYSALLYLLFTDSFLEDNYKELSYREGQMVSIKAYLVAIVNNKGQAWESSVEKFAEARNPTKILWVQQIEEIEPK